MRIAIATLLLLVCVCASAAGEIDEKVTAALLAESRPQADRDRDENRMPLETLKFFGLKDDMRVLELLPGGGWYTRVLAPVLEENGQLYVAIATSNIEENLLRTEGFESVEVLKTTDNRRRPEGSRFNIVDDFEFGVSDIDMVLTFRNQHNFTVEARNTINREVFKSLKSGGFYGVIDHTRRHMEALDNENRRRVDPVQIIKELTSIGFEFVDYSDLHYRADDELEYEVGRRSVSGNTDRFTLLFRKP